MWRINPSLCRLMAVLSILVISGKGAVLDCYSSTPKAYDGYQQTTVNGNACIRWDLLNIYSASGYPDASISDAANFCRAPDNYNTPWCYITPSRVWEKCGMSKCGDDILTECGQLSMETPTVLGRNVSFSFTPDVHDPNAKLYWQRKKVSASSWSTLSLKYKFIQYQTNGTFHLVLTDSIKYDDEQMYRVHYYNETMYCRMETQKLDLKGTPCGLVQLRSERVIKNGTVEIEYYPPNNVLSDPQNFERQLWQLSFNMKSIRLHPKEGFFEEELEQDDIYVMTLFEFNESMNGFYMVYCGSDLKYTNSVTVKIKEPPSLPVIIGLQDIDGCNDCIVGEVREKFNVSCVINNGTKPLDVTMTIGNESYSVFPYNATSTTYLVFFTLQENHHMEKVSISVKNSALSSPLQANARMYVIKPPTVETFLVPDILREGDDINITCTMDEGRPIPNVYFNISGFKVSSAYLDARTSANENIISLTTFQREWNQESITCCRYNKWYKNQLECSPPKQVDYLFPPSKVKLAVKFDAERQNQMYAVCTVYNSNPACKVQFSAPGEIIGSERYSRHLSLPHAAWNTEYAVDLNVDEEDNGELVTCNVDCDELSVNLREEARIQHPYPPVIKFNISGSVFNITEGKTAYVECLAESVPASNITWIEELSNGTVTKKQCNMAPNCVLSFDADAISKRRFKCSTHYMTSTNSKQLTVYITENINDNEEQREKQKVNDETSDKLIIWIVIGACLLVTCGIIAVVLIVVIKKRRRNPEEKKESRVSYQANVDTVRNPQHKNENDLQRNENEAAHAQNIEDEIPEYSKPIKKKTKENADNTYSQVNKAGSSSQQHHTNDGQLVYADLDFDPNEAKPKAAAVKRPDSPTEYADIDYVKTKAEKDTANTTVEPENIYANQ